MKAFGLSVPANLLLAGEYAVTEEGGRGIALACGPRARLAASEAPRLEIRGTMGRESLVWREGEAAPPLIAACLAEARSRAGAPPAPALLEIDSSAFFAPDGSKRGFGSSAAVALALSAALLRLGGLGGGRLEEAIFPAALAAHRGAQGGRGSGYDVAASRFGGLGVFRGGARPSWTGLGGAAPAAFAGLGLFLVAGPRPVSSADSVARYRDWAAREGAAHRAFLSASDLAIEAFLAAARPAELLAALADAGRLGAGLGDSIGVPAHPVWPESATAGLDRRRAVLKCLGAGDELILLATTAALDGAAPGLEPVRPEGEGLRWE